MRLRAERSFPYAGGSVQAGEYFQARSANDAIALKLGKLAVEAPEPAIESDEKPKRIAKRRSSEESPDGD